MLGFVAKEPAILYCIFMPRSGKNLGVGRFYEDFEREVNSGIFSPSVMYACRPNTVLRAALSSSLIAIFYDLDIWEARLAGSFFFGTRPFSCPPLQLQNGPL